MVSCTFQSRPNHFISDVCERMVHVYRGIESDIKIGSRIHIHYILIYLHKRGYCISRFISFQKIS